MAINKETILVLPGSTWQIPLVKKIKGLGYRVLVVNPFEDSPCFGYSDGYLRSDIFNKEKVLTYAKENKVNAVISDECDIATELVATLAENLGLPTLTSKIAKLYTNKVMMRDFLRQHNLPCPAYKICYTLGDALIFYRSLNKKMIMKPIDSNSSHGVFTINSETELKIHFKESKSFSRTQNAVICEQYINGTEFTVDGVMSKYGHTCLAISEKKHYKHNENIAYQLFFSHNNLDYDYNRLREINDTYVNLSQLPFGLTHAEYKYENGEFFLIEIGARGGGNLISAEIVPIMSGYDNYDALIKMALNQQNITKPTVNTKLWNRCSVLYFFDTPEEGGIVKSVEGEELLKSDKHILTYKFNFSIGDKIEKAKSDTARIGFYIAYGDSREELLQFMDLVNQQFIIRYK